MVNLRMVAVGGGHFGAGSEITLLALCGITQEGWSLTCIAKTVETI